MNTHSQVRVIVCECGPIIKEALDLDALLARLSALPEVKSAERYGEPCSPQGKEWLRELFASDPATPVVIGGCSLREHGADFEAVCEAAGKNPYLLVLANIREQGTAVTPDRRAAGEKAERIIRAAIARALTQEPLAARTIPASADVLVLGAGIAGLSAARLLARADRKVLLVERSAAIGGRIPLLAELFPSFECASCMLEPLMDEILHDPHITVKTNSELREVTGFLGNFTARVATSAAHVNPEGCYGCKSCVAACPVEVGSECDFGLTKRKAIYIPYEGALPNVPSIDADNCLRTSGNDCRDCTAACPFGNIDLTAAPTESTHTIGAVLVASGCEELALAPLSKLTRVLPVMALERLQNSSGPTAGEPVLPGAAPLRRVAFVHCLDEDGHGPSSSCSRICCLAIAKNIHSLRAKLEECEIVELLWERSVGGKGYRELYDEVVHKARVRQIWLAPGDTIDELTQSAEGAAVRYTMGGEEETLVADLVIYAPPLVGAPALVPAAQLLRLSLDEQGFVHKDHPRLRPFATRTEGVFVAGGAERPSDAAEAASSGAAAAGAVLSALLPGRQLSISPEKAAVDEQRCGGCRSCVLVCPYGAIRFDDTRRVAEINDVLCRGCGACAAACPANAILAKNYSDHQLLAELLAGLG